MKLALWQGYSPAGNRSVAINEVSRALHAAGALGAAVLVVPEVFLPGYNVTSIPDHAITQDDVAFDQLADICRSAQCALVLGYAERRGANVHNAAVVFGADGDRIAHYRKIQLFGAREKSIYAAGASYTIFDLLNEKAAILICYDIEFAAHVAALAAQGVTLILVPTANMEPFDHVVRHTVLTMAANYGVTIVYANYCGSEGDLTYVGGSLIAGPHGEVLAQAGRVPALLVAEKPERDAARLSTQITDLIDIPAIQKLHAMI